MIKPIVEMSFEEWIKRDDDGFKFKLVHASELPRLCAGLDKTDKMFAQAVAHYLGRAANDVPDNIGGIYCAAALALIHEPIDDKELLEVAHRATLNLAPLYDSNQVKKQLLVNLWRYHYRVELEAARVAYDRKKAG